MNIWTRLGISVALAAAFYITVSEILQDKLVYEVHKWRFCVAFLVAGAALFFTGSWLNRRIRARYHEAQAGFPEAERDDDPAHGEPFLLLNPAYWGIMLAVFSAIIVVIVPAPREKEPAPEVAARTTPPAAPTNTPALKLQGVIIRNNGRSALINGQTYFIGDIVEGAKLIAIEPNQVILDRQGVSVTLPAPR